MLLHLCVQSDNDVQNTMQLWATRHGGECFVSEKLYSLKVASSLPHSCSEYQRAAVNNILRSGILIDMLPKDKHLIVTLALVRECFS